MLSVICVQCGEAYLQPDLGDPGHRCRARTGRPDHWPAIQAASLLIAKLCPEDKAQLDRIEAMLARIDWSRISTDSATPASRTIPAAGSQCPICGAGYIFAMPGPIYRTCACAAVAHLPLYQGPSG